MQALAIGLRNYTYIMDQPCAPLLICRCPLWVVIMQSHRAGSGVDWCRAAVLLLTLSLTNKCGSAITFEKFVGYPFDDSNGYSVFPRGVDYARGLPIPVPFPYFGRTFSYANVSVYTQKKMQHAYMHGLVLRSTLHSE